MVTALFHVFVFVFCLVVNFDLHDSREIDGQPRAGVQVPKLSAVMLTTSKDGAIFEKGIVSALKHLVDVDKFYIITPNKEDLSVKYKFLGERVIFVAEQTFKAGDIAFTGELVADTMLSAVKERGVYPLDNGKSQFEKLLWGKLGWHLQQLLKLYAGRILNLDDYVLLDGDCIWFQDTHFIAAEQSEDASGRGLRTYLYATSTQVNGPYKASSERINGVPFIAREEGGFRSGVVHHMVLVKQVLESLFEVSEKFNGGDPFWKVMLKQSALEMTCRAPKQGICGAGSTLSEYELYFNYARVKFPQTVQLRPLLWANGPKPGLLYWPDPSDAPVVPLLSSDCAQYKWKGHRQSEALEVLERQMEADRLSGFSFVGYHSYAKRRYFELHKRDVEQICHGVAAPFNTSCSYRGLDREEFRPDRTAEDWFKGCGCFMARNRGCGD